RGQRIRVDANLANGSARREAATSESVDENLTAVWTSRRTSQRLQRSREIVRIVRQRIEVRAFEHNSAGVVLRFGADFTAISGNSYFCLFDCDFQRDVELVGFTGSNFDFRVFKDRETGIHHA